MESNKPWYKSKTVWGGIVALLAGIAGIFGYTLGIEEQAVLTSALIGIGSAVGGLLAVYGRVTAVEKVKAS